MSLSHFHSPVVFFRHIWRFSVSTTGENNWMVPVYFCTMSFCISVRQGGHWPAYVFVCGDWTATWEVEAYPVSSQTPTVLHYLVIFNATDVCQFTVGLSWTVVSGCVLPLVEGCQVVLKITGWQLLVLFSVTVGLCVCSSIISTGHAYISTHQSS